MVINAIVNLSSYVIVNLFFIIIDLIKLFKNTRELIRELRKPKTDTLGDMQKLQSEYPGEFDEFYPQIIEEKKQKDKLIDHVRHRKFLYRNGFTALDLTKLEENEWYQQTLKNTLIPEKQKYKRELYSLRLEERQKLLDKKL